MKMHLVCPPKFCITFFLKFLLDIVVAPGEIENNAYAKVLTYLFYFLFYFLGVVGGANKVNLGNVKMGNTKIYYIDTSVLLENIPLVKFIKTTSGTRVVYFPSTRT